MRLESSRRIFGQRAEIEVKTRRGASANSGYRTVQPVNGCCHDACWLPRDSMHTAAGGSKRAVEVVTGTGLDLRT